MQRLDRLGWAVGTPVRAYGMSLGLRTTDPGLLAPMLAALPPGWKPAARAGVDQMFSLVAGGTTGTRAIRRMFVLYRGWVREARGRDLEPVLEALEHLARMEVAEHSPNRVFIHAGTVGWRGRAIVVPGRSHAGKSTLVAELVRQGATYYSDEYAVIDARGRIHPFPAPLKMREPGAFRGSPVDMDQLGTPGHRPLPLGAVAVTRFKEGSRFRPREISRGDAALALLENTVSARHAPGQALKAIRAATAPAISLKGVRGEAPEAAEYLLRLWD